MGELRLVYKCSVGEPEGKRPLGRPRHRWEDSIRIGFGRLAVCGVDSVDLGYRLVAGSCESDDGSGATELDKLVLLSELRRLRVFV
jgi:hypothetical protein